MLTKILHTFLISIALSSTSILFAAADDGDDFYTEGTEGGLSIGVFLEGEEEERVRQYRSIQIIRSANTLPSAELQATQARPALQDEAHQRQIEEAKERQINKKLIDRFYDAALLNDISAMHEIIDQIDFMYFETLLRIITRFDRIDVIEDLFNNNGFSVNIESYDENRNSILSYAIHYNSTQVFNFLMKKFVNIYMYNKDGNTPLHIAAAKGHLEMVKSLVAAGAKMDKKNENGDTALDLAIRNGHRKVKKYLLSQLSLFESLRNNIKFTFSFSSH